MNRVASDHPIRLVVRADFILVIAVNQIVGDRYVGVGGSVGGINPGVSASNGQVVQREIRNVYQVEDIIAGGAVAAIEDRRLGWCSFDRQSAVGRREGDG